MDIWSIILVLIVITVINFVIHLAWKPAGTLRIDRSNPEKDLYRIEIDNLDELSKYRKIVLRIDNNADLSHK